MQRAKTKKILVVFGTRPEAIKFAPIISALELHSNIETRICVTAQHRQLLDQVLELFAIAVDYDLNLMREDQDLTDITVNVLSALRDILREFQPDLVLVQGDTTTAFAASLASFYEKIAVAHIEAGLRSDDICSPWPEEMSRRLTAVLASFHFAPTEQAAQNLLRENIAANTIFVTGNTVIDSLLLVIARINKDAELRNKLHQQFNFLDDSLKLILVTGHRRESFGGGFKEICYGLRELAERNKVQIVYPVHLNPHVQQPVRGILGDIDNIILLEPLDYLPFVYLMSKSYLILTDSGGVQEEAPSLGKPVLIMRDTTERPEAVQAGTAKLVGANQYRIVAEAEKLLNNSVEYDAMSKIHNPFGDGMAAQQIVTRVLKNG